ncbi:MAG: hypothetical protein AAF823_10510 [Planctomycetota bacterium]
MSRIRKTVGQSTACPSARSGRPCIDDEESGEDGSAEAEGRTGCMRRV